MSRWREPPAYSPIDQPRLASAEAVASGALAAGDDAADDVAEADGEAAGEGVADAFAGALAAPEPGVAAAFVDGDCVLAGAELFGDDFGATGAPADAEAVADGEAEGWEVGDAEGFGVDEGAATENVADSAAGASARSSERKRYSVVPLGLTVTRGSAALASTTRIGVHAPPACRSSSTSTPPGTRAPVLSRRAPVRVTV